MTNYDDLLHAAQVAIHRRDEGGFITAMDAAEAAGLPRVDAMVLHLDAASVLPTDDRVRRALAREYLTLVADAATTSLDPSIHNPLLVVKRLVDGCRHRPALIAELSDELLAQLDQVPDDAPYALDKHGVVLAEASDYKDTVHEIIRQSRRAMGTE